MQMIIDEAYARKNQKYIDGLSVLLCRSRLLWVRLEPCTNCVSRIRKNNSGERNKRVGGKVFYFVVAKKIQKPIGAD